MKNPVKVQELKRRDTMRVQPIAPIFKLASSTVKDEYPKHIVDNPCSTVVSLGQKTFAQLYDKQCKIK